MLPLWIVLQAQRDKALQILDITLKAETVMTFGALTTMVTFFCEEEVCLSVQQWDSLMFF